MRKDSNIIIRIDSSLKDEATKIANKEGFSLTDLVTGYLRDTLRRKRVPLFVYSLVPERKRTNQINISDIKNALEELINKYGKGKVSKAYLFGSYARSEETPDSDIDLRLETDDGFSIFDLGNIRVDLEEKLHRSVDLLCADDSDFDLVFLTNMKKDEICIYERDR